MDYKNLSGGESQRHANPAIIVNAGRFALVAVRPRIEASSLSIVAGAVPLICDVFPVLVIRKADTSETPDSGYLARL
jgi:hypothetical protein